MDAFISAYVHGLATSRALRRSVLVAWLCILAAGVYGAVQTFSLLKLQARAVVMHHSRCALTRPRTRPDSSHPW